MRFSKKSAKYENDKIGNNLYKRIFDGMHGSYLGLTLFHFYEGKPNLQKVGKYCCGVIKLVCMSITVMPSLQMVRMISIFPMRKDCETWVCSALRKEE